MLQIPNYPPDLAIAVVTSWPLAFTIVSLTAIYLVRRCFREAMAKEEARLSRERRSMPPAGEDR